MIKQTTRYFAVAGALAAGLLLSDPASAQQGGQDGRKPGQHQDARGRRGERGDRGERRLAQLTERLRLTEQQAAQVRRIFDEERTQMQALRQRNGQGARPQGQPGQRPEGARPDGQRRQPPAEVVALHARTTQQIERVLNEGQRAEFRKLREEREARRREGGERRGGRDGQEGRRQGAGQTTRSR
ncbi:MAG TPA: Spy/CpxP family protein refolding chaperone [Longimicrobium sp.]|nr:Spy/CpxP family protein refolding chaperone [Longimicrobium sp.]